jgi:hypothetical protein
MTIASNLYATKVFSEHPIALYALDDDVSYLSLISNDERLFDSGEWSASATGSASVVFDDSPELPNLSSPFDSDIYSSIRIEGVSEDNTTITCLSPELFNLSNLNQELKTFSISLYLYQSSAFVNYYEIGYVYYDSFLGAEKEIVTRVEAQEGTSWINFNFTYNPPNYEEVPVKLLIRANVNEGGSVDEYSFIVNGISIGQWSEQTSSISLGAISASCPLGLNGVPALEYGIQEDSGHYIVEDNALLAKNYGIPLVYGSDNLTEIYPSKIGNPSLIIPGNGFLYESGRFSDYTVEFWMRINPNTQESRRIFGPVDKNDGIYIRDNTISLVLGNNFGSHPVSEWYRPMLVHVSLKNDTASLIINGEEVVSISFNKSTIPMSSINNILGFYSYEDISNFQIDCVSFYPYAIPVQVAKRRFVYGQGTNSPQSISDAFDGINAYTNFSNANYTTDKVYPDIGNWESGYSNNLNSTRFSLNAPSYSLPEVVISGRNLEELYEQNKQTNEINEETFFTFRPLSPSNINLVPNFTFDEGIFGWEGINSAVLSIEFDSINEENSLKISSLNIWDKVLNDESGELEWDDWDDDDWENVYYFNASGSVCGAQLSSTIQITGNVAYLFSTQVKVEENQPLDPYLVLQWLDSEGNQIGEDVESTSEEVPLNEWIERSIISVSPPLATQVRLIFYMSQSEVDAGQYQEIKDVQFYPLETNWTEPGYIFFESLNFVDRLSALYGVFSIRDTYSYSPLIVIKNTNTSDDFRIIIEKNTIQYLFNDEVLYFEEIENDIPTTSVYNYSGYSYQNFSEEYVSFVVGIDIKKFSNNFGYNVSQFFKSSEFLQMYVSGDTEKTFYDKLYKVGFSNKNNYRKIEDLFFENGIVDRYAYETLHNHFASYTLIPLNRFDRFFFDISIDASWEEYFPLSSFASITRGTRGQKIYDLDLLQLNLGYSPITEVVTETIENTGWTYLELYEKYNNPVQKSYEILDNALLSGYSNYDDLNNNNISELFLNTEKSSLRSYITFQLLSEGANEPLENFPYTKDLIECCFIDTESVNTQTNPFRSYLTKFEFVDKTVVFPPKRIDFKEVAMVVHFQIQQEGILSNPLKIREFEIASRALNEYQFNPIGTESGLPLYPYVKTGIYYNNKEKNPVLVSKKRTPYLYLKEDSGIRVMGRQTFNKEYGVAMPINQQQEDDYLVGAMQTWIKYDSISFPPVPFPIFEIQSRDKTIEFVILSDSSAKRGIVTARNKRTKIIEQGITFYQNGIRVKNILLEKNVWSSISMSFETPLVFDEYFGYINLFRGCTFNNISYYKVSGLGEILSIVPRTWLRVLVDTIDDIEVNFDWQYWYDENGSSEIKQWTDVYVVDSKRTAALTPKEIYKAFVGTSRIVIDDGAGLIVDADSLSVVSSRTKNVVDQSADTIVIDSPISWSRFSGKPA